MKTNGILNPPRINNSVANKVNNVAISRVGAWSSGGNLGTIRYGCGGAGVQTAGLACGGYTGAVVIKSTEEYNGTSWSGGGDMAANKYYLAAIGVQTAGLAFGGDDPHNNSEEYDGTNWSTGGNMSVGRREPAGSGTQTAGLAIAGHSALNTTEEYNGTSWSGGGNLSAGRTHSCGFGAQDDCVACGGSDNAGTVLNTTEEYNGTSWSGGGDLLEAISGTNGSSGTQTSGLLFGGYNSGAKKATNYYNGSIWTADADLNSVRDQHVGCGTRNLALCFAGRNGTMDIVNTTEEYTKAA